MYQLAGYCGVTESKFNGERILNMGLDLGIGSQKF